MTVAVLAFSRSCAVPSRCQSVPLADTKTTGVAPAAVFDPAAMNPAAVRSSTLIWSPGWSGRDAVAGGVRDFAAEGMAGI